MIKDIHQFTILQQKSRQQLQSAKVQNITPGKIPSANKLDIDCSAFHLYCLIITQKDTDWSGRKFFAAIWCKLLHTEIRGDKKNILKNLPPCYFTFNPYKTTPHSPLVQKTQHLAWNHTNLVSIWARGCVQDGWHSVETDFSPASPVLLHVQK